MQLTEEQLESLTEPQRREYNLLLAGPVVADSSHRGKTLNLLCKMGIAKRNWSRADKREYVLRKPEDQQKAPNIEKTTAFIPDSPSELKRAPGIYSNRSQEQVINKYLNM